MTTLKGRFTPKNTSKCVTPNKCIYRSSWELKFMNKLDISEKVVKWGSEPFHIRYYFPLDEKWHRYYPDFYVELKSGKKFLIEVKPHIQTQAVKTHTNKGRKRSAKRVLTEKITYAKNRIKWKYAEQFCKRKKISFVVITENDLKNLNIL